MSLTINNFNIVGETLRLNDLRQIIYDELATLTYKVLANYHGKKHQITRKVDTKIARPDTLIFNWTEIQLDTWVKLEQ